VVGIRVREQQVQLALTEIVGQSLQLRSDLSGELLVLRRELGQFDEVPCAPLERVPSGDLLAILGRVASQAAGRFRVVPDPGRGKLGL
jgi:hypothetical protein